MLSKIGIAATSGLFTILVGLVKFITGTSSSLWAFAKVFKFLALSTASYLKFFIPLTALLRVFDSAKAQGKLADYKRGAENANLLAKELVHIGKVITKIICTNNIRNWINLVVVLAFFLKEGSG